MTTDELSVPKPKNYGLSYPECLFTTCVICKDSMFRPQYSPTDPTPKGYRPRCEKCLESPQINIQYTIKSTGKPGLYRLTQSFAYYCIFFFMLICKLFVDLVLTTDELFVPSPEYKGNDLTKILFRKCVICKRNMHDPIYKPGVPTPNGYRPRCERCVKLMLLMVDSAMQHICKNLGY